jgi:diguanylate cyclase (GGDEF)-like protein/PAS domain S-box-containing protein
MVSRNAASRRIAGGRSPTAKRFSPGKSEAFAHALNALAAYRRDRVLQAVAAAAKELLRTSDLAVSLPLVGEQIGRATGVDRVHFFIIDGESHDGRILQHQVWSSPDVPLPDEFKNTVAPLAEVGLQSWIPRLAQGEIIAGHVRELDAATRPLFERGGVKSVMSVPIFADKRWLGLIGFDDCRCERDWSPAEIDTIETLAELVGAAVERTEQLRRLADANRIVENSSTILYRLGPQPPFPLIYLSQNIERYGYAAKDLLADPAGWPQIIEAEDLPAMTGQIHTLLSGAQVTASAEFRVKKADGSVAWFNGHGTLLRDAGGKVAGIEGILTDITERKRAESEQAFAHTLLSTALENAPDAILVVDAADRIMVSNRHFAELWKIPPELVKAGNDGPVLKAVAAQTADESGFLARVKYLYEHPEIRSHEEIELADGRIVDRRSGSLYDPQRNYLGRVWFFRDITENKLAAERIARLARTDSLTGLPNRAAFLDRLALEFARARRGGKPFAVHYLDLDHFKDVNDTLGHPVGDKLLCAVAERLAQCVRETDLVARFGGDEFAVLQDNVGDLGAMERLATKIGAVLSAPYDLDGNRLSTSASIGIVPYRGDITSIDAMMMKADVALYRAKSDGRNLYRIHIDALDEETRKRVAVGEDLRQAAERKEFELYYQPQVDMASGAIVGLEALVRWNHPTRGRLLPDDFIPIAETTGSIVAIGDWVIGEACRQIARWREALIAPPRVAVNLSGAQFKLASHLDDIVLDSLARHRVAPQSLELELTESVLVETTLRHREALERLRKAGVRLAIDDFGTGYSSLDYLRAFHVSRLKIDRRFIDRVTSSADDRAIANATIGLARALGIEVVAEGVETEAQRDFLLEAGCSLAQGFLFGKPMPAAEIAALLRRHQPAKAS